MIVTSAQYVLDPMSDSNENACIKARIDDQEMFVPIEEGNRHYQAILEWVAEGNEIQAAE